MGDVFIDGKTTGKQKVMILTPFFLVGGGLLEDGFGGAPFL